MELKDMFILVPEFLEIHAYSEILKKCMEIYIMKLLCMSFKSFITVITLPFIPCFHKLLKSPDSGITVRVFLF